MADKEFMIDHYLGTSKEEDSPIVTMTHDEFMYPTWPYLFSINDWAKNM